MKEEEANALRTENATLKGEVSRLQLELEELLAGTRVPTPNAPPADPPRAEPQSSFGDVDWLYACIKKRALEDSDPKMLALFAPAREIEVTRSVERIRVDFKTQPGFLAAMIVDGYFGKPMAGNAVVEELKRRGRSVHHANVYRDLNRLAEQGFLTKEGDGYQAVPGMKVNIIEA